MNFKNELVALLDKSKAQWEIYGLLTKDDAVFSLGSDTKVLSTIFELLCAPFIHQIADKFGYKVEEAQQTVYPDFTLLKSVSDDKKIAIDIKTTYRRGERPFGFTLGSYTSFLRNNTKNILYPYDTYKEHWIIGFVYSRKDTVKNEMRYDLKDRKIIICPYHNVEYFIQEKYKIAGERPGSGNTANIGSIYSANLDDFRNGIGPFTKLGAEVFEDYWRNFNIDSSKRKYNNLSEYLRKKKG